jgi:glycosyltransferase involved in cell wall biosynthesis
MKLCFLAAANSIHSYRWIKYFAEAGHEVSWISMVPSIFEALPEVRYFQVDGASRLFGLLSAAVKVRKIIAQLQPDILHVHYLGTNGLMGLLSGFHPIIATPWGSDVIFGKKSLVKRPLIARLLRRAAIITCDADHMRNEVTRFGVPAARIHIINFGIDTERFAPRPLGQDNLCKAHSATAQTVISLRSFEPVYDIATLLMAVPKVLEQHRNAHFILVGRGSLETKLKDMSSQLGIDHAVSFVGFVANDQMADTLRNQDVYVSTSLSDAGIASSTAEAMACGLPVVITDSGENSRWITDGLNGFLVPVGSPDILADRLNRLLGDAELRQRFGQAGRATIMARNDYCTEMSKMENLYNCIRKEQLIKY